MNNTIKILLMIFLVNVFGTVYADDNENDNDNEKKTKIVRFSGTAIGEDRMIEDGMGGFISATCFDIDMLNLKSGKKIGKGIDCLSNITNVGGGLSVLATSIFVFKNGTLVNRGLTSVQPKTVGSPNITHITGAIPAPGDKSIIASLGTGKYAGKTGQARLSGAVTMNPLADGRLEITFDCIFVISMDKN